jgi:hypothetical protein
MKTFYTLHVHRRDGSQQNHVMQGQVPKVGDTVFATLAGNKVSAKVGAVTDMPRSIPRRLRDKVIIEVHAKEEV